MKAGDLQAVASKLVDSMAMTGSTIPDTEREWSLFQPALRACQTRLTGVLVHHFYQLTNAVVW